MTRWVVLMVWSTTAAAVLPPLEVGPGSSTAAGLEVLEAEVGEGEGVTTTTTTTDTVTLAGAPTTAVTATTTRTSDDQPDRGKGSS